MPSAITNIRELSLPAENSLEQILDHSPFNQTPVLFPQRNPEFQPCTSLTSHKVTKDRLCLAQAMSETRRKALLYSRIIYSESQTHELRTSHLKCLLNFRSKSLRKRAPFKKLMKKIIKSKYLFWYLETKNIYWTPCSGRIHVP